MSKLGTAEYMQGLVEVERLIGEVADVLVTLSVPEGTLGKLDRALDLIRQRLFWPKEEDGKIGFYCEDCGLVCYVNEDWFDRDPGRFDRCPQCGSWGFLFIEGEKWQPPKRYGTLERRVCEHCGTIVYGARGKECPMCKAELR